MIYRAGDRMRYVESLIQLRVPNILRKLLWCPGSLELSAFICTMHTGSLHRGLTKFEFKGSEGKQARSGGSDGCVGSDFQLAEAVVPEVTFDVLHLGCISQIIFLC
jgi:hypothetical protein